MCEFCMQHGDGKKWYLEAENYAADLSADLARREYMIDFVSGFDTRMKRNVKLLDAVKASPKPIQAAFKAISQPRQIRDHYGQPVPIEECERIFDFATSVTQLPCVCRHFAGTPEEGYCLAVTVKPVDDVLAEAFAGYGDGPDTAKFQHLTREQAMELLRRTEREGLMHSVWTFKTPFIAAICNCNLAAGCMAMKTTLEWGHKTMWKGEYRAEVDETACTGCGACVGRCPFDAIALDARDVAVSDAEACYGCGICRSACAQHAITLVDRAPAGTTAVAW
jgi:NAD-dependent dihydropyrimidine dehydrogenase PreA subunit